MKSVARKLFRLILVALPFWAQAAGTNWMTLLNPNLSLAQISIPGTHDSGARFEPIPGTAKCQNLTIAQQLNAGVRFLDIRCRHIDNAFIIHHGFVNQNLRFEDVLADIITFLDSNPDECVILSIKEEYDAKGNSRPFEKTFDSYVTRQRGKWRLDAAIPTLAQARGRIVLFRRFRAGVNPLGIDASSWPDNAAFSRGLLRIQDIYNVTNRDSKWQAITNLLEEAYLGDAGTLFVNFASGVRKSLGIPDIRSVSDDINLRLTACFASRPSGRYGIILMDFADAEKCALIYGAQPVAAKPKNP